MASVLASSVVGRGYRARQVKRNMHIHLYMFYEIEICCFYVKHATVSGKSKD